MEWKYGLVLQKSVGATLDFPFDWKALTNGRGRSDWLATGETISSYTVTAPGLTIVSQALTNSSTTIMPFLSGGTLGSQYTVTVDITTNLGRIDRKAIKIFIIE